MKERERILELVKEGVISTEEALVLLENSAHKEGKAAVKKEQANIQKPILKKAPVAPIPEIKEENQLNRFYQILKMSLRKVKHV